MLLPYDLLSQIFPLLSYLMKCDRLDGLVKTELAPYVICVVVDLARESCTASSEQPVNEDVWKQCCDWGIAASKRTPTHCPDWSHYQPAFDFHMQKKKKPQVEDQYVARLEYGFYCCVRVVQLRDHEKGPIRRGKRAKCERWWILNVLEMIY